jgi:pyroglutamyl-peptidase
MKLLLTGFEPFGHSQINPAAEVVRVMAEHEIEGVELVTAVLPVHRFDGPDVLIRTYIKSRPDAVLCLGESGNRMALAIERVAINLLDFRISDNGGHLVTDKPIHENGPAAYFTTLPVRAMVGAVEEIGVPAELSLSAGAFLCNQVIYEILHYIATHRLATPAGFVHLPQLPDQVAGQRPSRPSMSLETMCRGATAVIQTIATHLSTPHKRHVGAMISN